MDPETLKAGVRDRYAEVVTHSLQVPLAARTPSGPQAELQPGCCSTVSTCGCAPGEASLALGYDPQDLATVPEGANLGLGCGNPVALAALRPGETVLDLGSGAGFDAFLAARQVGPEGQVIGVDMTPEMIARATALARTHGYGNVAFRLGDIEALPLEAGSVDVVISNCVVNLTPDKARTFREAFRVLKPGGRLMVSDLVVAQPLPEAIRQDMDAYGACVAGALLKSDYLQAITAAGFEAVVIQGERGYSLDLFSPDLLAAARQRYPELSEAELAGVAGAVLSLQVAAVKPVAARACGCAPTCCEG